MSERKDFLLRLSTDEHAALRRLAQLTDTPMNAIVIEALHEYFQGTGRKKFVKASATRTQDKFEALLDKLADQNHRKRVNDTADRVLKSHADALRRLGE